MLNFNRYQRNQSFRLLDNLEALNYNFSEDKKYLTVYGKVNEYLDLEGGELFYCLVPITFRIERSTFTYKIRDLYDKSIVFTTKEGLDLFLEQNADKFKDREQFKMFERVKYKDKFCIYDKI